ncbi:MAG: DUF2809 domain-containing protein [Verrucomicrobiota bacterium]
MQHRLHIRPARNYVTQPLPARKRVLYAVLAVVAVASGLLWRSRYMPLPPVISKYGGDALWALVVFVGCGFLFSRASTLTIAMLALTFCWGIEFSQLYHGPWIDAMRATLPGRLVLGSTFNWPDLPAYALGIGIGAWVEWRLRRESSNVRR